MGLSVTLTTSDPMCPSCGADLCRVRLLPHGADSDGVVYLARMCRNQKIFFGRSADGSWSIPVTPTHIR
jgi:hypothetical protein